MNYIREINAFYDWLETNTLADSAINLWHALMHVANKAGWPEEFAVALSTLQSKTGLKKDAVITARNRLQNAGRITFKSRSGQQSAVYHIVPLFNCVGLTDTNPDTNSALTPTQSATQTPTQTPSINKLNNTKLNELNNPPIIPQGEGEQKSREPFKDIRQEQLFDMFWDKYPKKKSKGQAEKAWIKILPDDLLFRRIINSLETAKISREWKKDNGQFIPYPATWLNAQGWLDEYSQTNGEREEEKDFGWHRET
ncbi:MAG: hypothetical protein ABFD18_06370 [Syntrophomonas sp.]